MNVNELYTFESQTQVIKKTLGKETICKNFFIWIQMKKHLIGLVNVIIYK
jgi:hypothetical protein